MAKRPKKNDRQPLLAGLEEAGAESPAAASATAAPVATGAPVGRPGFESPAAVAETNPRLPPGAKENNESRPTLEETLPDDFDGQPPDDVPLKAQQLVDLKGKKVWIIDSMSLIFQVFHAIPNMTSPRGEPVNAVFGFTRDMFTILEQRKPDYLFCALESEKPTFRHVLYEAYKEHRSEFPADLIPQLPQIRRVLAVMGIPVLECDGYEADDILATVARVTDECGGECTIVTSDKDCRQLITDRVRLYNMRKNSAMDKDVLMDDWGVRPDQVVDFQTLVGDSVDNIPGIPLIGPKLARELLQKYDTLEGLYQHIDELSGKRKENLVAGRNQAFDTRKLVRLDSYTPIDIPWDQGCCTGFDPEAAATLFEELGFHALTEKMRSQIKERLVEWQVRYETIDTPERLEWLVDELSVQKRISFDTETTHIAPRFAEIVGYSFAWNEGESYYIPVRAPDGERRLDPEQTLEALRPILENPLVEKVGQNLKYDMIVLRTAGVEVKGACFDTMVASYLLDAGERNHNLDELAERYLRYKTTKIETLIGSGKTQRRMDEVPVSQVTHYAAEDADVALRLVPLLDARLKEASLDPLFNELEVPLIDVLVELEYNGMRIDPVRLGQLSREYGGRLLKLEGEIYELAGRQFNIGSPKQLQEILFVEQKLPVLKRTKTGPSTDVDVLDELARLHPLPAKIIEYRQYAKLKSTYVDALPTMIHPQTGRIHASFNQTVAATGRLSSSDPNLQNIPIRTQESREIRSAFLPGEDDWLLLACDYSQIELRVLAHFSGDETLRESFAKNEDVHARVASQVFGVPLDQVTSQQRRVAKAVNFGVIYGQSPFGLSKTIDIPQDEAARFIDNYFAGYPGVTKFLGQILWDCREKGYVTTIRGRRRTINGVRDPGWANGAVADRFSRSRNLAERTAINTVIQGSAADIIKLAMLNIYHRLRRENRRGRMLLQIHDELVFEVPPDELEDVTQLVIEEMAEAEDLSVPLAVDIKTGKNWTECE